MIHSREGVRFRTLFTQKWNALFLLAINFTIMKSSVWFYRKIYRQYLRKCMNIPGNFSLNFLLDVRYRRHFLRRPQWINSTDGLVFSLQIRAASVLLVKPEHRKNFSELQKRCSWHFFKSNMWSVMWQTEKWKQIILLVHYVLGKSGSI